MLDITKTTIHIGLGEKFFSIARLAATTIKDRAVICHFVAILFNNQRTDISMDILSLFGSSS